MQVPEAETLAFLRSIGLGELSEAFVLRSLSPIRDRGPAVREAEGHAGLREPSGLDSQPSGQSVKVMRPLFAVYQLLRMLYQKEA